MKKRIIETELAPAAVGPYSQAVAVGNLLSVSGQVALVPGEGKRLDNESITAETHRVMQNVGAILAAAGCGFADVTRAYAYLSDQAHFAEFNAAYGEYFEDTEPPARMCVVAAPPLNGANVEVAVDAYIPTTE